MKIAKHEFEIQGLEHDWLAMDELGQLALLSTAGAGYAPAKFLEDTDAHDIAISDVLALPPTTQAAFAPELPISRVNTWKLMAERGVHAFDCDPNGGPYHLVAAPIIPAAATDLPASALRVASQIRLRLRFRDSPIITSEMLTMLKCRS